MRKENASLLVSISIACLCASLVVQVWRSFVAPTGVINATDPLKAAPPQKTRDIGVGDMMVASRTGSLEYTFPISVVPNNFWSDHNCF